ncbi:MAG: peroxidase family protein [Pseudomonadota bacterium]
MNNLTYGARKLSHALQGYPAAVLAALKQAASALFDVLKTILSPVVGILAPLLVQALQNYAPKVWEWLTGFERVRHFITGIVIKKFGNNTKPRPHPFSMHARYPTWTGLVNRAFTGRHLGPPKARRAPHRPDPADLEHLFLRPVPTGGQINDVRSNLLFAAFAQWFTDSFLRTSHKLTYDGAGNTRDAPDGTKEREPGRERENESNHEIDLCQIYGMTRQTARTLRFLPGDPGYDATRDKGTLRSQWIDDGSEFPAALLSCAPGTPRSADDKGARTPLSFQPEFKDLYADEKLLRSIFSSAIQNERGYETLFACGLEHGNSTIGNSLFNTLFLRHHNYVARKIAANHCCFDDDEVFEKARNVMIVILLKIVICDYVRHISPMNLPFSVPPNAGKGEDWYRRNRIHIEFNLLYRWHGLIPDVFPFLGHLDDPPRNFASYRHNNGWMMREGIGKTLQHFMQTPAGMMTMGNTPQALRMVKRDTLKLMRAVNLASYNDYRARFGLHKAKSFEEVTGEKVLAAALSDLYQGRIEDLEFYIGLVAERHGKDGMMGDLMLNMVAHDALTHALTNPLLAEEMHVKLDGYKKPGAHVFSETGKEIIDTVETLDDLVRNVVPDLPEGTTISFRAPGK